MKDRRTMLTNRTQVNNKAKLFIEIKQKQKCLNENFQEEEMLSEQAKVTVQPVYLNLSAMQRRDTVAKLQNLDFD